MKKQQVAELFALTILQATPHIRDIYYTTRLTRMDMLKSIAHLEVFMTKKNDELVPPKECSRCHSVCRVYAHHPDYEDPQLIEWLCNKCHFEQHRYEKRGRTTLNIDMTNQQWQDFVAWTVKQGYGTVSQAISDMLLEKLAESINIS